MEISNQSLKFHSDALAEDTLLLTRLRGEERLSGPFRFELELVSQERELDLEAVLYQPAKLGILQRLGPDERSFLWFQGALESIRQLEEHEGLIAYRAVLVPHLARLREFQRSRIFQEVTIDELVTEVLDGSLRLKRDLDFELKLTRTKPGDRKTRPVYPEREYVVQYEESDLDFLARWLEHEGIFYLFENDGDKELVRFADSSGAYKPVNPRGSAYPYRPQGKSRATGGEQGRGDAEDILSFRAEVTRLPRLVKLNDYNWRDPSMSLEAQKPVHEKGTGLHIEYNDHYKTPQQGAALAEARAQEWTCSGLVFEGTSTCRAFRPGKKFELEEHFRADWNRSYLLVSVVHEAEQSINMEGSNVTASDYRNTFTAIPSDREYRPARTTAWPSIHGVMNARIDGEGEGEVADLDDHGRYKLRFPFDEHASDAAPGKASRWVRMAQPYAGPMAGMHFTLLKGTEVVVIHVDGDPDRPLIAGALPNPEHVAPTHAGNPTQNQILTVTGNQFQMDDNRESNGFVLRDANRNFVMDMRMPSGPGATRPGTGGGTGGERRPGPKKLQATLEKKLGALPRGAPVSAHAEAFRAALGPKVSGGTGSLLIPQGPTGFSAVITVPFTGVKLSWTHDGAHTVSYSVQRATVATPLVFTEVALLATSDTTWLDDTAALDSSYTYRVLANGNGVSAGSSNATVSTPKDGTSAGDLAVQDEFLIGENTAGSSDDDEYDPRNTQSISVLEDFLRYCDQDPSCQMRDYYEAGLALLNPKAQGDHGGFTLPGSDPQYQLWARKFNSWLAIAWGTIGEINISNCNQYSYVNNSYVVQFGTGGSSYTEQNGNSSAKKVVNGNQSERSEVNGDQTGYSEVHGNAIKDSYTYGDTDEHETFIGHKVKTSINISTNREASIAIGATAKAALELDAVASAKFHLGPEVSIDINIAATAKLEIVAAAELTVELKTTKTVLEAVTSKLSVVVPKTTDVRLEETQAALKRTDAMLDEAVLTLSSQHARLARTTSELSETTNTLSEQQNKLSKKSNVLSNQLNALEAKRMGLALDTVALKRGVAALQNQQTAMLHMIS